MSIPSSKLETFSSTAGELGIHPIPWAYIEKERSMFAPCFARFFNPKLYRERAENLLQSQSLYIGKS